MFKVSKVTGIKLLPNCQHGVCIGEISCHSSQGEISCHSSHKKSNDQQNSEASIQIFKS